MPTINVGLIFGILINESSLTYSISLVISLVTVWISQLKFHLKYIGGISLILINFIIEFNFIQLY
jgi:hypothetical protein